MTYETTLLDKYLNEWDFTCEVSGSLTDGESAQGKWQREIKDFEFHGGKISRKTGYMDVYFNILTLDNFPDNFREQSIYNLKKDIYDFIADNHEVYVYEE